VVNSVTGSRSGGCVRASDESTIFLPASYGHAAGELVVGLLPEHLSLRQDESAETPTIDGVVRHVWALR
jgi:hypothetical protein